MRNISPSPSVALWFNHCEQHMHSHPIGKHSTNLCRPVLFDQCQDFCALENRVIVLCIVRLALFGQSVGTAVAASHGKRRIRRAQGHLSSGCTSLSHLCLRYLVSPELLLLTQLLSLPRRGSGPSFVELALPSCKSLEAVALDIRRV